MDKSSLIDHVKLIYKFVTAKKPEWQSLANKAQIQFARNTLMLLMLVSIVTYILSGKSFQNILVVTLVNSFLLSLMHERTFIIMKFISIITCMGIPMVRFFLVGKETILYNQIHISIASMAVLLFTDSYSLTSLCFIYIAFFSKFNTSIILEEYFSSPEKFQTTLKYFVDHYHIINLLIWIIVSLIVYQKQALLSQLWIKQKEKEQLLAQVQKQNIELQKLNQSKTKLLLGLSHEFRNPINAALGNIELANERVTDNTTRKYLVNCKVSIEMLFHLVSNLLDSTKLEAGVLEINHLQRDSKAMFYKVWSIVKNLLDKQNLTGEFYIHKAIPRTLKVDSHFLVKILLNLILNAIKYTHDGAVMTVITWLDEDTLTEPMLQPTMSFYSKFLTTFSTRKKSLRIERMSHVQSQGSYDFHGTSMSPRDFDVPLERTFETEPDCVHDRLIHQPSMTLIDAFQGASKHYEKLSNKQDMTGSSQHCDPLMEKRRYKTHGFLKFEVFDSGCGIDDNIQKSIFEKFSSLSIGTEDRLGLGLGLWLTKNLCETIGGRVKAFSEKNKGSQFVAIVPAESIETIRTSTLLTNGLQKLSPQKSLKFPARLTALVVDDDKYNREITSVFLGKAGVTVKAEAVNGQEAVHLFTSKPPNYYDMVIMDLEMPIMNGKEAVRQIREYERQHRRTPVKVVIATGNCVSTEYTECMEKSGTIKADFFYRKPLLKKDFEEFVEILQKEKSDQRTCVIINGDILIVEFLQSLLKRYQIHVISLDSIEEAEKIVLEGSINLKWVLVNLSQRQQEMEDFLQIVRDGSGTSRVVEVIGLCEFMTAKEKKYCEKLGVEKIIYPPLTQEDIRSAFNLECRGS